MRLQPCRDGCRKGDDDSRPQSRGLGCKQQPEVNDTAHDKQRDNVEWWYRRNNSPDTELQGNGESQDDCGSRNVLRSLHTFLLMPGQECTPDCFLV